ncbi:paraquat-inducible protein B [Halomonas elongata]|uniref:Paraquat-inducible protein B n=1 Tax=Halomonas elongata TaxID=2746 RepID=A0A1B8P2R0_HALEL|nr:paraquat-inducible protein B [Halomonas elongata]
MPEDLPPGQPVSPDTTFTLHPDEQSAREGTFDEYLEYVLLVENTVRGLSKGAPVEFRGVRLGTVASVPWNFTAPQPDDRDRLAIPVLIRIEPQRLGVDKLDLDDWRERFDRLFGLGLRASLKSGSLLTGALFVDLTFDDQRAGEHKAETFAGRTVFPTTSTGLAQIQSQVTALLDKLNALEVAPILTGLEDNLTTSKAMLEEVRKLTASMQSLLDDPGTRELPGSLNATLKELQGTLEGLSADSPAYRELTDTLDQVERLMRDLQPAARKISEDPRALLFDSIDAEDPTPRAPDTRSQP